MASSKNRTYRYANLSTPLEPAYSNHARKTMPPSPQAFMGVEHFNILGDDLNIPHCKTSRLFTELCFPVLGDSYLKRRRRAKRYEGLAKVDPSELGLVLSNREAEGMDYHPVIRQRATPPTGAVIHLDIDPLDTEWHHTYMGTVIEAESVICFSPAAYRGKANFSNVALGALEKIRSVLAQEEFF